MIIKYRNMSFFFETDKDSCWYNLDNQSSIHKNYTLTINADRDVYALIKVGDKTVEGYITEEEDTSPIPDNYPIDNEVYHFRRLKKPGYYL